VTEQTDWTSINFTKPERDRIKVFADRGRRNVRNQILVWLEAAEALYADVTPEIQDKVDTVKNLSRPGTNTLDETV